VQAPTLLIVGGNDEVVIDLNEQALDEMQQGAEKKLMIVPGASHLFEEPGTLEYAARRARDWFQKHLDRVSVR
jgi:pimeloyl-ACP methyl ester carboxylesterase